MKNKFSFALIYMCLLLLFSVGVYEIAFTGSEQRISESEKRELQAFPEFSLENVISGRFMDEFESFLSDAFAARDEAKAFTDSVKGIFRYGDAEETITDAFDPSMMAAPPAELYESDDEAAAEPESVPAPLFENTTQISETAVPQETGLPEEPAEEKIASHAGENLLYWLVKEDGSKEILFSYEYYYVGTLAKVLNDYRACLPEDGSLHFVSVPISQIANRIQLGSCTDWDSNLTELLQPLVDEGVYIYDGMDLLRPYLDTQYLFYTDDHHWNSAGTSYSASGILDTMGIPTVDYDEYMYYLASEKGDTVYSTQQLAGMKIGTTDSPIMKPRTPMQYWAMYRYAQQLIELEPIERLRLGYYEYFGGILKSWRWIETGYHTGRTACIIGDSFTNSFTFYLMPYYDTIIVADFRDESYNSGEAGASAHQYMDLFGVDDIYVVCCTMTPVTGYMLQNRMPLFLEK